MSKDFYDILGVSESATAPEIKKAFRSLAKKYHPDRNKGNAQAESRFKEISEAYETLSDPKKKAQYDQLRKYGAFAGAPGGGNFNGQDFSQFFRQGKGGQGGFQTFSFGGSSGLGGLDEILSQFFDGRGEDIFGGRTRQRSSGQPMRGGDIIADLSVSFHEALTGTSRLVDVGGKKLKVKIPKGIDNGDKIRLKGQGQPSPMGGPNGDLIIKVGVMPDQKFDRKGNDIYTTVTVSFKEAILGTKVKVDTLTKKVSLTLPPGTQPGTKMRLKGQGLAVGKVQGDLFVTVNVDIPTSVTREQRELLERWG